MSSTSIDQVAALVGGWRDRFSDSFETGRLLAAAMARVKGDDPHHAVISKIIDENGGRDFLRKLHSQIAQFTAGREPHSVIGCERLTVGQTCQAVEAALRAGWS